MSYQAGKEEKEPESKVVIKLETKTQPPDGGWGWVVCFASFMVNFTVQGMMSSNGIILLGVKDIFSKSISKATPVSSVNSALALCGGPLALGLLLCKASHRQIMMSGGIIAAASAVASAFCPGVEILILTYGISAGLSMAMAFFASNVILGHYFDKKLAIAAGIANSGSGIGCMVLNYLIERSISFYGMRGTFLLIGGILLNLTVYGSLCRPLQPKSSHNISDSRQNSEVGKELTNLGFTQDDENTETQVEGSAASCAKNIEGSEPMPETLQKRSLSVSLKQTPRDFAKLRSYYCALTIFRNKTFILLLAIYLSWAVGAPLLLYLPAYGESVGLSRKECALIMSIYGIFLTLSQILLGFLADVILIPVSYILLSALFGMSLSILSISYCQTFAAITASMITFAIFFGFGVALRLVLVTKLFGVEKMSEAYSVMTILVGVGYTVYPYINGMVYDATHSFTWIFYMDSALTFLGAILSCGVIYAQKKGTFD